jgi:hypothetical protein
VRHGEENSSHGLSLGLGLSLGHGLSVGLGIDLDMPFQV